MPSPGVDLAIGFEILFKDVGLLPLDFFLG